MAGLSTRVLVLFAIFCFVASIHEVDGSRYRSRSRSRRYRSHGSSGGVGGSGAVVAIVLVSVCVVVAVAVLLIYFRHRLPCCRGQSSSKVSSSPSATPRPIKAFPDDNDNGPTSISTGATTNPYEAYKLPAYDQPPPSDAYPPPEERVNSPPPPYSYNPYAFSAQQQEGALP